MATARLWQLHAAQCEAGSQQVGQGVNLSHLLCKASSARPVTCTSKQSTEGRQRQGLLSW